MGKLVILKLGEGNFDRGFSVILQIGAEGKQSSTEITGKLPPAPEIPQQYESWQSTYRRLGLGLRLEAPAAQVTNLSIFQDCHNAAQALSDSMNRWLNSEVFRPVKETFLKKLKPSDKIRLILQTEDWQLRRLPWHLWELFTEDYTQVEIGLSASKYDLAEKRSPKIKNNKIRILAILGNSAGIDIQKDRALLEQIPSAEIHFLVEPKRQELTEQLWEQGWDFLFFAGHSSSQAESEKGFLYINPTDRISIGELKDALRKAIKRDLKLAIFNSCDGLGLAHELAELHIPQIIVMREPVPDKVAQVFLNYFLKAFSGEESLYLAVREARERLKDLEDEFPCASWLPIICQNPAEVPLSWQELLKTSDNKSDDKQSLGSSHKTKRKVKVVSVLAASVLTTGLVIVVRWLGILQPFELWAFDQLMRLRPDEPQDSRLLIITIDDKDIQYQNQKGMKMQGSLSDRALIEILTKLAQYKPQTIGLDIYRDGNPELVDLPVRMQQNASLFAVCKVSDPESDIPGFPAPKGIPLERQGFSDVVVDDDDVLRRQLLHLSPHPASPCRTKYALSLQLAMHYLAKKGIQPQVTPDGYLKFGNISLNPLEIRTGGYQKVDAWGYQVLLNYRSYRSPQNIAPQISLREFLTGEIDPNAVKDRIVLIGVTAPSAGDYWSTPYGAGLNQKIPGVIIQAQMVSQIVSAALNNRSLIWVWPLWGESLWIWGWSLVGGILSLNFPRQRYQVLAGSAALGTLFLICLSIFTQAGWIPLVPAALALVGTGAVTLAYMAAQNKQK
ncbi:CHASE2 domain-containing protein [Aerosakkonema funiforme]|uniref:CHASE2 domain-containing protein n=1 Tax=Aerosakkonema funiforme TaxID=1246630 RepID=UPI0035B6B782